MVRYSRKQPLDDTIVPKVHRNNDIFYDEMQTEDVLNLRYTKTEIDNRLTDKVSVSTFNDAIQQKTD